MTAAYDAQRDAAGNIPIWVLEIDIPQCANDYGVSPCTASLGATSISTLLK